MIASAFNIILGQRLVRRLCEHCKKERDTTAEEQKMIGGIMEQSVAINTIFDAPGCELCGFTGFKGRIGVMEGVRVDDIVEHALLTDPRETNILEAAKSQNIPSMQQDGIMKVLAGITSLDELARVLDLYAAMQEAERAQAALPPVVTPEVVPPVAPPDGVPPATETTPIPEGVPQPVVTTEVPQATPPATEQAPTQSSLQLPS
jgi:hypothetical protein